MENIKYYSDLITDEQIRKWIDNKDYVYLNGSTGTGKSTFVFDKLIPFILDNEEYNDKQIILFSNRLKLKQQHKSTFRKNNSVYADIDHKHYRYPDDYYYKRIIITTYQGFYQNMSTNLMDSIDCGLLDPDDYIIICDECHYFINDNWNKTTEQTLNILLHLQAPIFFISATGNSIVNYINQISTKIFPENTITIEQNYSNITLIDYKENHNYKDNKATGTDKAIEMIRDILDNTSDKVMYYLDDRDKLGKIAMQLREKYKDDILLCYGGCHKIYSIPDNDLDKCLINGKIAGRCILTTRILDNGVDIFDDDLKHVIIDMNEAETIIQAIGRKRTKTPLNVYINEVDKRSIRNWIKQTQSKINTSMSRLNTFKHHARISELESYLDIGVTNTIYNKLKHTQIKLKSENGKEILQTDLEYYTVHNLPINREYFKILLSDAGLSGKRPDNINKILADNGYNYKIEVKRNNKSRDWYVCRT